MTKRKILIADDHALFNDGLKAILESEKDMEVVGQVFSGNNVLGQVRILKPAILLLDINMPGKTGMELLEILSKESPVVSVIILSMYSDSRFVKECRRMNASGYILKNASKEKLITAIRTVQAGKIYYDPALDGQKPSHQDDEFIKKTKLTKREIEIIRLIKNDHTSQDIAKILFLSPFTVETHRRNINLKLGIKNTLGLIRFAAEHGI
jgi:DNA-binding NarL/FixJ family response regulator